MKKKYEKPVLMIESFQLDATVAASCSSQDGIPIHYGESNCVFDGGAYFNYNNCDEDVTGSDDDGHDTICYHGPELTGGLTFTYS